MMTLRHYLALLVLSSAAASSAPAREPQPPSPTEKGKLVLTVDEVKVRVLESHPAQLAIDARGTTSTAGWTKPQLQVQSEQAKDGTLTLKFVATPPSGVAAQVIAPISATTTVTKPNDFRRVVVIARTNQKVEP